MERSTERTLTTHAGRLTRPHALRPHKYEVPLRDIVDLILAVRSSIDTSNPAMTTSGECGKPSSTPTTARS
jgi:hypothetical protein